MELYGQVVRTPAKSSLNLYKLCAITTDGKSPTTEKCKSVKLYCAHTISVFCRRN